MFGSNSTSAQICDSEDCTHVPCLCENGENKVSTGLNEQTRICTQVYKDTWILYILTHTDCLFIVYVQTVNT